MSRRTKRRQRRIIIGVAAIAALCSIVVRTTGVVSSGERTAVATILGLAAMCTLLGLLADPTDGRVTQPYLFMDGTTVVRLADDRDNGKIIDTIDDEVVQAMGWLDEHRDNWASMTARIDPSNANVYVITRTGDQRPIGVITVMGADDIVTPKLGMWLGPNGRGEGHMRRAMTLLTDNLRQNGISCLSETAASNIAAQKSLVGAGFHQIGTKLHRLPNGTEVDALLFARYAEPETRDRALRLASSILRRPGD